MTIDPISLTLALPKSFFLGFATPDTEFGQPAKLHGGIEQPFWGEINCVHSRTHN